MVPLLLFIIALLSVALGASVSTIMGLRDAARFWKDEAMSYKALWLASLLDDGGLEVEQEAEIVKARGKAVGE